MRDEQEAAGSLRPPGADDGLAEWRERAERIAPLVDGVEYYGALRQALIGARRQVLVVGWELHSEIDLLRGEQAARAGRDEAWPIRFADLLERLVEENEGLEIRLLIWEGASLFALERQHLPRMKRPWSRHPRIRLHWDGDTPRLASQHQKVVVVDDRIAFAGGMDLTKSRWDDHPHRLRDGRRRNPGLIASQGAPYHDIMVAVDGPAAARLGEWGRERWRRATGEVLEAPEPLPADAGDAWPAGLQPILRHREVAIALTQPGQTERPEKRQVERSFLRQVEAAGELIFIETQYLAWGGIVDLLCQRLRSSGGPELILILPHGCPGRLQAMSMDPRRDELLDRLRRADPGGRLGVYWATLQGREPDDTEGCSVYVHAKTMVVDDRLLRIGSANLNNRSLGLDSELDLFVEIGKDDSEGLAAVRSYRQRLLAYLLDVAPERVAQAEDELGSVVAAIEALRGGERTLQAFEHRAPELTTAARLPIDLADPDRPMTELDAERVLAAMKADRRLRESLRKGFDELVGALRRSKGPLVLVGLAAALALAWTLTPLGELLDPEGLRRGLAGLPDGPAGLLGLLGAFVLLASLGFPITVLVSVTGASLEPERALPVALLGTIGAAAVDYSLGRLLPWRLNRPGSSERLRAVAKRIEGRGVLAVAVVRNVPIAPFAVVNVACGLAGLSWWRYLTGTFIGMSPGVVLLALFGREIRSLLSDPSPLGLLQVAGVAAAVIACAVGADALLRRLGGTVKSEDASSDEGGEG